MPERITLDSFEEPLPLIVNRQPNQGPIDLHSHAFTELVVILDGTSIHFSGEDAYPIKAGDCFVVEGAHGYKRSRDLSLVNILFIPERLPLPWSEARKLPGYHAFFALEPQYRKLHNFRSRLTFSPSSLAQIKQLIDELEVELKLKRPGFEIMAMSHFMQLIGTISRAYARMQGVFYSGLQGLSEVISHIERNYAEPIRIADLVKMSSLSETRLLKDFHRATHYSPIDYLIRLRIQHAAVLLRQTGLSITEIAYRVGFNDSNYFTRQFQKTMHISPREYRKKQHSQQ